MITPTLTVPDNVLPAAQRAMSAWTTFYGTSSRTTDNCIIVGLHWLPLDLPSEASRRHGSQAESKGPSRAAQKNTARGGVCPLKETECPQSFYLYLRFSSV